MTSTGTTHRRRWAMRAGLATVILVAAPLLLAGPYQHLFGTVVGSTAGEPGEAPCLPGQPVEIMDSPHISEAEAESVRYNSLPPTSGPHFAFTVATGIYQRPVPEGLTIHAMEHGHIVIQYAVTVPEPEVADLTRLARRYGADVVLAPYPPLADGIALTAWGRIDLLERYDERRTTEFIERLRGRYHHGWTSSHDCS